MILFLQLYIFKVEFNQGRYINAIYTWVWNVHGMIQEQEDKIYLVKVHICDVTDNFITSFKPTLKMYKCKILTSKRTGLWIFLQVISYFNNIQADLLKLQAFSTSNERIFYTYSILLQYYFIYYKSMMTKLYLMNSET